MNEIRLNKLSIRDFQGGNFTFSLNGKDVVVYGMNASGKTRLVSAFSWLLFNKDALGRADFQLKNLDAMGEVAHNLEHTVIADLDVNGETVNLKKVFKEKWTKRRGNAEREFSGHTTEYAINGVPVQEKDYISQIAEITHDESRFRLLTSPMVFPALHWQKQRALLLEVCGDISDTDVIASSPKLSLLPLILGKHSLDDYRKIVISRRSEINKEIISLPIRIDEVHRGLPDVAGIDQKASEKEAQGLETALNDAKLRLQGVNTGGNIGNLTKKLSGLNADLRKMEDSHRFGSMSTVNRLNYRISEVDFNLSTSRRRISAIDGDLKAKDGQLQTIINDLSRVRDQWIAIDSQGFKDTDSTSCPACGQSLPAEKVQDARDRTLATFNSSKAERLKEVNAHGMVLKEQKERFEGEIKASQDEKNALSLNIIPAMESEFKQVMADRDALRHSSEDFSGLPNRSELLDEIEDIESQIKAEREGKAQDIEIAQATVREQQARYDLAKGIVDRFAQREQGENRIAELKAEEKKLSKEFEKLEGEIYLMEQFIKTKVSLLTDRINGKFEMVKFKLFNQLISGGIEDCCEITVNGVPYNAGLNNSARIQAGCDIIRTLQQNFAMKAPVFCDNRESVTDLPEMGCQLISLVVSPEDKSLRVEIY